MSSLLKRAFKGSSEKVTDAVRRSSEKVTANLKPAFLRDSLTSKDLKKDGSPVTRANSDRQNGHTNARSNSDPDISLPGKNASAPEIGRRASAEASVGVTDRKSSKQDSKGGTETLQAGVTDRRSSKQGRGGSSSSTAVPSRSDGCLDYTMPVESFVTTGLLPLPPSDPGLLMVSSEESVADVMQKMNTQRLRSCVVTDKHGSKFFDFMDINRFLLQVMSEEPSATDDQSWQAMKIRLRRVASASVKEALKSSRSSFVQVDSTDSMDKVLKLFKAKRRVALMKGGELTRVITAGDILEMCCCLTEESKSCLETKLGDIIDKRTIEPVSEDLSMLEVLQRMSQTGARVAPVLEGVARTPNNDMPGNRRSLSRKASILEGEAERGLVGQFDISLLKMIFMKSDAWGDPGSPVKVDEDQDEAHSGMWWEDSTFSSNFILEPCMDFMALGGRLLASITPHGDSLPYHSLVSETPLSQAILRTITNEKRTVMITSVLGDGDDKQMKILEGAVTPFDILLALLDGEYFKSMVFDASRQRPSRQGLSQQFRLDRRVPTLSKIESPTKTYGDPEAQQNAVRSVKVKFHNVVQLDKLAVPTCPEHGMHFMKFVKGDEGKRGVDFKALKEWVSDAKALGAAAKCEACQRPLGNIEPYELPLSTPQKLSDKGFFGLPSFASTSVSGLIADAAKPLIRKSRTLESLAGGLTRSASMQVMPTQSAMSDKSPHVLRKSKTAERLDAIRKKEEEKEQSVSTFSGRRPLWSCCTSCEVSSNKDQIPPPDKPEKLEKKDAKKG